MPATTATARRIEPTQLLRALFEITTAPHGNFAPRLLQTLARACGADLALLARPMDHAARRVRVLAANRNGHPVQPWDYDLATTPCAGVYSGSVQAIARGLDAEYPREDGFVYESYIGIPLMDSRRTVSGHLALFSERALAPDPELLDGLRVAAYLAQAEIGRILVEGQRDALLAELERSNAQLQEQSIVDPLTRVHNRRYFAGRCLQEFVRSRRHGSNFGIVVVDLDQEEHIEQQLGRAAADSVLVILADCVHGCTRMNVDTMARIAPSRFALLCPDTDEYALADIAERVRSAVAERPFRYQDRRLEVTVSVGAAFSHEQDADWNEVLERADVALVRSRVDGRNRVSVDW